EAESLAAGSRRRSRGFVGESSEGRRSSDAIAGIGWIEARIVWAFIRPEGQMLSLLSYLRNGKFSGLVVRGHRPGSHRLRRRRRRRSQHSLDRREGFGSVALDGFRSMDLGDESETGTVLRFFPRNEQASFGYLQEGRIPTRRRDGCFRRRGELGHGLRHRSWVPEAEWVVGLKASPCGAFYRRMASQNRSFQKIVDHTMDQNSTDFFESSVLLDQTHYQEGFRDGYADGWASGKEEGRKLGLNIGFQVCEELGFYKGCLDVWTSVACTDQGAFSDRVKNIEQMDALVSTYPLSDPEDEQVQEIMGKIRLKFRVITASLGVKL
ncbi:hypothetical protein EJB05_15047, partial [Eragrostis curvula]